MNCTKGEWAYTDTDIRSSYPFTIRADRQIIAQVHDVGPESEDNARLMAAARPMYEALKLLMEWQNSNFGPWAEPRPRLPAGFTRQQLINKAESAIAKAEGRG